MCVPILIAYTGQRYKMQRNKGRRSYRGHLVLWRMTTVQKIKQEGSELF
jgi:hypothetical protein